MPSNGRPLEEEEEEEDEEEKKTFMPLLFRGLQVKGREPRDE
jgi:hypothetical protein